MTTPTEIADLIRATAPPAERDERPGVLFLRAALADADLRQRWLALRKALPDYLLTVSIVEADGDAVLEDPDVPPEDRLYRITVETKADAAQLRLFFAETLAGAETDFASVEHVLIASMGPHETFSTFRNRVQLWSSDPLEPFAPSEALPDPRTYASDFTGGAEVPADIRPWLLRGEPNQQGAAYRTWGQLAARRLLAALADRVARKDATITYHFSGPPTCVVSLTDGEALALLPRLQESGLWLYPDVRDADTRHLLLASEWARTHRQGDVAQLGERSLDSAKNAYAAYVKAGSKETLKALSELRRAVVDEGQKAAQRAQDLAGSMWKDIAIAAVPFVLKLLPDAAKAPSRALAGVLAICAAAFLIFSFAIQVFINKRYFRSQKAARVVWKRALNVALTPSEVEEYSEAPINAGVADYRRVRSAVGAVYALLVLALLVFASWSFLAPPDKPSAPSAGTTLVTAASSGPASGAPPAASSVAPSRPAPPSSQPPAPKAVQPAPRPGTATVPESRP